MDSREICQKIESFLISHPKAAVQIIAERLGLSRSEIEQAVREAEGLSLEEFRRRKRLMEAFKQLGADRVVPYGPWEKARLRTRIIIPRTSVQYSVHHFWRIRPSFSAPCPLVNLSSGGLAFLADVALMPGKQVSLLLKLQEKEEGLRLLGKVVYAVATGIAGYSWRIGIQFLQFAERRGCNNPKVLEALVQFDSK